MRISWLTALVIAASLAGVARADDPLIESGADEWLITSDISPFVLRSATLRTEGPRKYDDLIAPGPYDSSAGAKYQDEVRNVSVYVGVDKFTNGANLDDAIEARFRDNRTARLSAKVGMISFAGNSLYLFCFPGPDCKQRIYVWRSGPDTNVEISVDAFSPVEYDSAGSPVSRSTAAPEPTEILEAYLARYPSALVAQPETDERRREFRRREVGHALKAVEQQLARVPSLPQEQRRDALMDVREAMVVWAELRQGAYGKPDAKREFDRISALAELPEDAQLRMLNDILQEYRAWWNANQGNPISLP
jgi:hypothetical protein